MKNTYSCIKHSPSRNHTFGLRGRNGRAITRFECLKELDCLQCRMMDYQSRDVKRIRIDEVVFMCRGFVREHVAVEWRDLKDRAMYGDRIGGS